MQLHYVHLPELLTEKPDTGWPVTVVLYSDAQARIEALESVALAAKLFLDEPTSESYRLQLQGLLTRADAGA